MYISSRVHDLGYNTILTVGESVTCIPLVYYVSMGEIWLL